MGKVELCGMRFFAHHGCFGEEKTIGNYFIVDFAADNLLEHVAGRILRHFRRVFPEIASASVSISKLNPPLGGEVGASKVTMGL